MAYFNHCNLYPLYFRMQKKLWVILLLFAQTAIAQKTNIKKNTYEKKAGTIQLRFYPLGLANILDMNVTAGADVFFAKNNAISIDAGYVFASAYEGGGLRGASGFIFRPGYKFYWASKSNWFGELSFIYKNIKYAGQESWVGRQVVNGVPAYEEFMRYTVRKEVYGIHAKMGFNFNISRRKRGNLSMEPYWGIGAQYRKYNADLAPGDVLRNGDTNGFLFEYGNRWTVAMPVGLRLMYRIR